MMIVKVFEGTTTTNLETAINDWLLTNSKICVANNIEFSITGYSDGTKWVALMRIKNIDKRTVKENSSSFSFT